tara:strand:+ start:206 stop:394 length:189 start_codon:yes stop_codon:yes gene_type:complete
MTFIANADSYYQPPDPVPHYLACPDHEDYIQLVPDEPEPGSGCDCQYIHMTMLMEKQEGDRE